jgi:hypothetical protein
LQYMFMFLIICNHIPFCRDLDKILSFLPSPQGNVMTCGVVWCGVVWCGVMWCDVE